MFTVEKNRIYMADGSGRTVAEITFSETEPGVYTIDHTFVDGSRRGEGLAGKLVSAAVEEIRRWGGQVCATCSYAVSWLERRSGGEA